MVSRLTGADPWHQSLLYTPREAAHSHHDEAVQRMIDAAEIFIGKPPLGPGEELVLLHNGRRYGILPAGWAGSAK
jgi:hypothetical protein